MSRLAGKVCVITGAAGGIGGATAQVFAREGAQVVGVDLLEHAVGELSLIADVTDETAVAELYARVRRELGRIDVLFNNAGISPNDDASVLETGLEAWERVQATNLRSVFLCCKHGIPHLLQAGGGSVINTASFVAVMGSATSQISYTASKGGVLALSRELGVEFAKRGVRVNALCPGPVDTPLLRELYASDPVAAQRRLVHVPMGRFAQADEIARRGALPRLRGVLLRQCHRVPGGRRDQRGVHDPAVAQLCDIKDTERPLCPTAASHSRPRRQPVRAARARRAATAPGARAATSSSARTATPPPARAARGSRWRRG